MEPTASQSSATAPNPFTSRFPIGSRAYFQPNLRLVDARSGTTDPSVAAPCEIYGVLFVPGKVLYEIDVIYSDGGEPRADHDEIRVRLERIPSDMICEGA